MAGEGNKLIALMKKMSRGGKKPPRGAAPRTGKRKRWFDVDLDFQLPDISINVPDIGKGESKDKGPVSTINGSMGTFGRQASTPTGVMPNFRRETAAPVSRSDSLETILSTATGYLASIDASLKAQLQQQQFAYNENQKQQREQTVEAGNKSPLGSFIGSKIDSGKGAFKEAAWDAAKLLGGVGAFYALLNFDDLKKKFDTVVDDSLKDYLGSAAVVGGAIAGAAGLAAGGRAAYRWNKRRKGAMAIAMMGHIWPEQASAAPARRGALGKFGQNAAKIAGKFGKLSIPAIVAGVAVDVLPTLFGVDPNGRTGGILGLLGNVIAGVGVGSVFGAPGAILGGVGGLGLGLYNYGKQILYGRPFAPPAGANAPEVPRTAYEVVYANGTFGSPEQSVGKSLTQMTVQEVLDFQRNVLVPNTKGNFANGNDGQIHTPVGAYQFTRETIEGLVNAGVAKRSDLFDQTTQDKLAAALWNQRRGGDISKTWAALVGTSPGQYANTPFSQMKNTIIGKEVGSYVGMQPSAFGGFQSTPSGIAHTYETAKEAITSLLEKAKPTRIMDISEVPTAGEALKYSSYIKDQAVIRENYMRGMQRNEKVVDTQGVSTNPYLASRSTRSDVGRVPNPAFRQNDIFKTFTYFNVKAA